MTAIPNDKRIPLSMIEEFSINDLGNENFSIQRNTSFPAKDGTGTDWFTLFENPYVMDKANYKQGKILSIFCTGQIFVTDSLTNEVEFHLKFNQSVTDFTSDTLTFAHAALDVERFNCYSECVLVNDGQALVHTKVELFDNSDTLKSTKSLHNLFTNDEWSLFDTEIFFEAKFNNSDSGNTMNVDQANVIVNYS